MNSPFGFDYNNQAVFHWLYNIAVYNILRTHMEDIDMRPSLRKEKSNLFITNPPKKHYTTPAIQEYRSIADKYKNYMDALSQKIDTVCQKEQYRTYLKEQKLNSVRNKLEERKH